MKKILSSICLFAAMATAFAGEPVSFPRRAGNCFRFAANDPAKPGENPTPAPPGWDYNRAPGSDPDGIETRTALFQGLLSIGAAMTPFQKFHAVIVFYADNIPTGERDQWTGTKLVPTAKPAREFHMRRQMPDGSWVDKFGLSRPRKTACDPTEPPPLSRYLFTIYLPDDFDIDGVIDTKYFVPPPVAPDALGVESMPANLTMNCWRFAANDPFKIGDDELAPPPPGWSFLDAPGADPDGKKTCAVMTKALVAAGARVATGECPTGFHRIVLLYSDFLPAHSRRYPDGLWNESPIREYHFLKQDADGSWHDKAGHLPARRIEWPTILPSGCVECGTFFLPDVFDVDAVAE